MTKSRKKLWAGLFILALLTPLGIILPAKFNAGGAWGEWGPEELRKLVGYMPKGLKGLADLWKAPVAGYNLACKGTSMAGQLMSYLASGLIGIVAVGLVIYLISLLVLKNEK